MSWRLFAYLMAGLDCAMAVWLVIVCVFEGAMLKPRPETTDATATALTMTLFVIANAVLALRTVNLEDQR